MDYLKLFLTAIVSYLIGSILTGEIVAKLRKVNIRAQGSGNIGATNVYRSMGSLFGALVLIGDILKGVLVVVVGSQLGKVMGVDLAAIAGIFVIAGHNWSIFANFRGGKGIATSLGVIITLTPASLLIVLPVWLLIFFTSGFVSLASVLAAIVYPVSILTIYPGDISKLALSVILAIFALYRHKSNIIRLFQGRENRVLYKNKRSTNEK